MKTYLYTRVGLIPSTDFTKLIDALHELYFLYKQQRYEYQALGDDPGAFFSEHYEKEIDALAVQLISVTTHINLQLELAPCPH